MVKKLIRIVDDFSIQMKKGFIRALILLVLQERKDRCDENYGVKIIEDIKEYTLGVWEPNAATIYPMLNSLKKDKLVEIAKTGEKNKKLYKITAKGQKVLKLLLEKYSEIVMAMRTILTGMTGTGNNYAFEDIVHILPDDDLFGWSNGKSTGEKLENLKYANHLIEERIDYYRNLKEYISREIAKVQS